MTPTVKIEMHLELFLIVAHEVQLLKCKKKINPKALSLLMKTWQTFL